MLYKNYKYILPKLSFLSDVIYWIAGLAILITGILRVKYYGQGGEFYTGNPIFWIKVSLYILVF